MDKRSKKRRMRKEMKAIGKKNESEIWRMKRRKKMLNKEVQDRKNEKHGGWERRKDRKKGSTRGMEKRIEKERLRIG